MNNQLTEPVKAVTKRSELPPIRISGVKAFIERCLTLDAALSCADISEDGSIMVTCTGLVISVWDAASFTLLFQLNRTGTRHHRKSPGVRIHLCKLSPCCTFLVTVDASHKVVLWDLWRERVLRVLTEPPPSRGLLFGAAGRRAVEKRRQRRFKQRMRRYDAETQKMAVEAEQKSAESKRATVDGDDQTATHEAGDGTEDGEHKPQDTTASGLKQRIETTPEFFFEPESRAGVDGVMQSARTRKSYSKAHHDDRITCLCFLPYEEHPAHTPEEDDNPNRGKYVLITGSADGTVRLWKTQSVDPPGATRGGAGSDLHRRRMAREARKRGGKRVERDPVVPVDGMALVRVSSAVQSMRIMRRSKQGANSDPLLCLVCALSSGKIAVFEFQGQGRLITEVLPDPGWLSSEGLQGGGGWDAQRHHSGGLTCLGCSADQCTLATGATDFTVKIWSTLPLMQDTRLQRSYDAASSAQSPVGTRVSVDDVMVQDQPRHSMSTMNGEQTPLHAPLAPRLILTLRHENIPIECVFSQDGRFCITSCRDGVIRVWKIHRDMASGEPVADSQGAQLCYQISLPMACLSVGGLQLWRSQAEAEFYESNPQPEQLGRKEKWRRGQLRPRYIGTLRVFVASRMLVFVLLENQFYKRRTTHHGEQAQADWTNRSQELFVDLHSRSEHPKVIRSAVNLIQRAFEISGQEHGRSGLMTGIRLGVLQRANQQTERTGGTRESAPSVQQGGSELQKYLRSGGLLKPAVEAGSKSGRARRSFRFDSPEDMRLFCRLIVEGRFTSWHVRDALKERWFPKKTFVLILGEKGLPPGATTQLVANMRRYGVTADQIVACMAKYPRISPLRMLSVFAQNSAGAESLFMLLSQGRKVDKVLSSMFWGGDVNGSHLPVGDGSGQGSASVDGRSGANVSSKHGRPAVLSIQSPDRELVPDALTRHSVSALLSGEHTLHVERLIQAKNRATLGIHSDHALAGGGDESKSRLDGSAESSPLVGALGCKTDTGKQAQARKHSTLESVQQSEHFKARVVRSNDHQQMERWASALGESLRVMMQDAERHVATPPVDPETGLMGPSRGVMAVGATSPPVALPGSSPQHTLRSPNMRSPSDSYASPHGGSGALGVVGMGGNMPAGAVYSPGMTTRAHQHARTVRASRLWMSGTNMMAHFGSMGQARKQQLLHRSQALSQQAVVRRRELRQHHQALAASRRRAVLTHMRDKVARARRRQPAGRVLEVEGRKVTVRQAPDGMRYVPLLRGQTVPTGRMKPFKFALSSAVVESEKAHQPEHLPEYGGWVLQSFASHTGSTYSRPSNISLREVPNQSPSDADGGALLTRSPPAVHLGQAAHNVAVTAATVLLRAQSEGKEPVLRKGDGSGGGELTEYVAAEPQRFHMPHEDHDTVARVLEGALRHENPDNSIQQSVAKVLTAEPLAVEESSETVQGTGVNDSPETERVDVNMPPTAIAHPLHPALDTFPPELGGIPGESMDTMLSDGAELSDELPDRSELPLDGGGMSLEQPDSAVDSDGGWGADMSSEVHLTGGMQVQFADLIQPADSPSYGRRRVRGQPSATTLAASSLRFRPMILETARSVASLDDPDEVQVLRERAMKGRLGVHGDAPGRSSRVVVMGPEQRV